MLHSNRITGNWIESQELVNKVRNWWSENCYHFIQRVWLKPARTAGTVPALYLVRPSRQSHLVQALTGVGIQRPFFTLVCIGLYAMVISA